MYPCHIPCFEHCYVKYGKQYEPKRCDDTCDYARAILENKELKRREEEREEKNKNTLKEIREYLVTINNSLNPYKHGVIYTMKKDELEHLAYLIKKLAD